MSQPLSWRWAYARRLADAYESQPEVRAVMVGGSVGRGTDDRFSDLELGAFWAADPTEDARTAAILDAGADLHHLYPQEADLWEDVMFIGHDAQRTPKSGLQVEVVHLRVQTVNRLLDELDFSEDASDFKLDLLRGLVDGVPMSGHGLLVTWQTKARSFPDALMQAVIRRFAVMEYFWRWEMYLERGAPRSLLAAHFWAVQQRLLTLLLALNRQPVLAAKWTRSVMPLLEVAPVQFQQRFEAVDRATPAEAAALLVALVDETYDLIERTVPGWKAGEVQRWRTLFHYQRPLWQEQPPT